MLNSKGLEVLIIHRSKVKNFTFFIKTDTKRLKICYTLLKGDEYENLFNKTQRVTRRFDKLLWRSFGLRFDRK